MFQEEQELDAANSTLSLEMLAEQTEMLKIRLEATDGPIFNQFNTYIKRQYPWWN